jgi:hypothetical protein
MITDKARSLSEQIESSVNALALETDAFRQSDTFTQWLNAMSTFSKYSFYNQILISLQRPNTQRVAGFQVWKKLGRSVKKGAKGIAILAPCTYRRKVDSDNPDSATVQRLAGFRTCWVFSLEDTDEEPLPELITSAACGGEDLLPKLERAAEKLSVALEYTENLEAGVEGYSSGGRIVVRASLPKSARCGVLVHELCHEQLHRGTRRQEARAKTKQQRELEAEATTYVVLRHFGIEHVASNYLAFYRVTGEQLRESPRPSVSQQSNLLVRLKRMRVSIYQISLKKQLRRRHSGVRAGVVQVRRHYGIGARLGRRVAQSLSQFSLSFLNKLQVACCRATVIRLMHPTG